MSSVGRWGWWGGQGEMRVVVLVGIGSFNPITYAHLRMMELARDAVDHPRGGDDTASQAISAGGSAGEEIEDSIRPPPDQTGKRKECVLGGYLCPIMHTCHKGALVHITHRINMLECAVRSSDWIMCDAWEAQQSGPVWSHQVLDHVREELEKFVLEHTRSKQIGVEVRMVVGQDVFRSMSSQDPLAHTPVWSLRTLFPLLEHYPLVIVGRCSQELKGGNGSSTKEEEDLFSTTLCDRGSGIVISFEKYRDKSVVVHHPMERNDVSSSHIRDMLLHGRTVRYLIPIGVLDYILQHHLYIDRT